MPFYFRDITSFGRDVIPPAQLQQNSCLHGHTQATPQGEQLRVRRQHFQAEQWQF
ncbi:hypothetical protein J3E68DRAFT_391109 [Trichoderma sp. SZMC 28012]